MQVLTRATAALLLIDARAGVTAADADAAAWLRRNAPECPLKVVAAKCDSFEKPQFVANVQEAAELGLGDAVPYSAETGAGTVELFAALQPLVDAHTAPAASGTAHPHGDGAAARHGDAGAGTLPQSAGASGAEAARQLTKQAAFAGWHISSTRGAGQADVEGASAASEQLSSSPAVAPPHAEQGSRDDELDGGAAGRHKHSNLGVDEAIKLAIVGLPNAGKSTLLNQLLGFDRAMTGPEPGLTRDAVSAEWLWRGLRFQLTDTAGWMRAATLSRFDEADGKVAGLTVAQVCTALLVACDNPFWHCSQPEAGAGMACKSSAARTRP